MSKNEMVLYDSPEAAQFVTGVSGWADRHGRFWGNELRADLRPQKLFSRAFPFLSLPFYRLAMFAKPHAKKIVIGHPVFTATYFTTWRMPIGPGRRHDRSVKIRAEGL